MCNTRYDEFNSPLVDGARFTGAYDLPMLARVAFQPTRAVPFHACNIAADKNQWIHFYEHDYRFECVWNNPPRYLPLFKKFSGVITPDFSLYRDMPIAMQIWNTYRNRAIGFWLQQNGICVVPNVRWGDERTYPFAFDGLRQGGTVAISTCGCIADAKDRFYFRSGLKKLAERIAPETIICYGQMPEDIFDVASLKGIRLINIENYAKTVRKAAP
ncbi:MAG: DUF4417 domain-containing protein [Oscillospiraceae bacterium]|jgi:hypothetical protein|nr:DUF4417 domain-containing protein [Oscillospiraceae bacterium]